MLRTTARVRVAPRVGEASAGLVGRARLRVPVALAVARMRRSARHVALPVTLSVRLPRELDRVEIDASVDNRARDQRLRLHVRAPWRARRLRVASAFERVERPIEPAEDAFGSRFTSELPSGAGPQRGFAVIDDGERAMTLANRGAPEIEAVHESDAASALAVTLLRAVGWLSRGDLVSRPFPAGPVFETPGAQAQGRHAIALSLRLHPVASAFASAEAERFSTPPCVLAHGGAAASPPEAAHAARSSSPPVSADTLRLLDVGDPQVLVSAIEPQEQRSVAIRLWNASDERRTVPVRWLAATGCRLEPVGLDGRPARDVTWECDVDGGIRLGFRPWQIVTLRAAPR